ncbi:MAG: thioredoxin family protein [Sediminibacterium sp.]|nr:thioredoxin family protein [Sediminibacterium sp.]
MSDKMNEQDYLEYVNSIITMPEEDRFPPYNNADYLEYTKLNASRKSRWLKTQSISEGLKQVVSYIKSPQNWIVITEPWCADAAHNIPFIILAARENPLISLSFELRDSPPNRIEQYLTGGTKSIPKLIIKDEKGNDLAIW